MLKGKGFETVLASPPAYDNLVVEIYFDGRLVALVSQERSQGLFDLETPGPNLVEKEIVRRVEVQGLSRAIEEACQRLRGLKP